MISFDKDIILYHIKLFLGDRTISSNKISNHIWLGNANCANDIGFLKEHKIQALFNITDIQKCPYTHIIFNINNWNGERSSLIKYIKYCDKHSYIPQYRYSVKDNLQSNQIVKLYMGLNKITRIMHEHISQGNNILVYCKAGAQRSASSIAAYFMKYYNMTLSDATYYIRRKRKIAFYAFPHFKNALVKFETDLKKRKNFIVDEKPILLNNNTAKEEVITI